MESLSTAFKRKQTIQSNSKQFNQSNAISDKNVVSSGEDISFNVDCSQAFQVMSGANTLDKPMTLSQVMPNDIKDIQRPLS